MGGSDQDTLEQSLHLNCKTFELESLCNITSLATGDLRNTWLVDVGGVARATKWLSRGYGDIPSTRKSLCLVVRSRADTSFPTCCGSAGGANQFADLP